MGKPVLAIDLGTSFLKGAAFLLEGRGLKILKFSKLSYNPFLINDFEKKLKELILFLKNKHNFNSAIIGGGEGIGKGRIKRSIFLRKSAPDPITDNELKEIIKKNQKEALVGVERESGKEKFFLVSAKIKNIAVDNRPIPSPVGLTGRKLSFKIVNFYLPLKIYQSLKKNLTSFNIKKISFEYIPQILPNFLLDYIRQNNSLSGFVGSKIKIFIDIGGKNTQLSIFEKGKIEKVIEVPFGGDYFIEKIAEELKIKPEQLFLNKTKDIIEFKVKKSSISSEDRQKVIKNILEKGNKIWRGKIISVLENYQQEKLPLEIYLLGGGDIFLFLEEFKEKLARKRLRCIIKRVGPLNLESIFNFNLNDSQATIPLLICKTLIKS